VTISHDVVERAARVVLETNAAAKIVSAKRSHETDGTSSGSPLSHGARSSQKPLTVDLDLGQGRFGVCLWPAWAPRSTRMRS
jgi:hypothetical protein